MSNTDLTVQVGLELESLRIAKAYLENQQNTEKTAEVLGISTGTVVHYITKPEVQLYITQVFNEVGFRNRETFFELLDEVIKTKLKDMVESGVGSEEDILTILKETHRMKMAELKMAMELQKIANNPPIHQTNIQNNIELGTNDPAYLKLVQSLAIGKKK